MIQKTQNKSERNRGHPLFPHPHFHSPPLPMYRVLSNTDLALKVPKLQQFPLDASLSQAPSDGINSVAYWGLKNLSDSTEVEAAHWDGQWCMKGDQDAE